MKAIVTATHNGLVTIQAAELHYTETLWQRHNDLRVGTVIEIEKRADNPYPVRVAPWYADGMCAVRREEVGA